MSNTDYIATIIKILETPKLQLLKNKYVVTKFRVQLPQRRGNRIVNLVLWGNSAKNITKYYRMNDYLLVQGHLSIRTFKNHILKKNSQKAYKKEILITPHRVYPFLLKNKKNNSNPI